MDFKNTDSSNYQDTLNWLFSRLPMFSRVGAAAYKPGLETSYRLDEFFSHPHRRFRSIHVGGTNGKGSTSHMLASILQSAGYKVGLYTSPHLVDFRERIRINGEMIPRNAVTDFVERFRNSGYEGSPSFFELTMMMAFDYFARNDVDFAVIEVGMGGRLDSTNIISPILSVITNISKDHTQFLGDTLLKIAAEKAGIIKPETPVVIGKAAGEIKELFSRKAEEANSPIVFAEDNKLLRSASKNVEGWDCKDASGSEFSVPLAGDYQKENINTVLNVLSVLRKKGVEISPEAVKEGFENTVRNTGLQGRWQIIGNSPLAVCDTGHNIAGLEFTINQLKELLKENPGAKLHFVIGFVNDKDVANIVNLFPHNAEYYFTQASVPRAMAVEEVAMHFSRAGIMGRIAGDPARAYKTALENAGDNDIIYVGGSTFVVADLLATL